MKRFTSLAFSAGLLLGGSAFGREEQSLSQLLSQAQTEYLRGEIEPAKRDFQAVLQADPRNLVAGNMLRVILSRESKGDTGNPLERQLSSLIIPKIDFKEATLDSVLDYLKKTAAKLSDGKVVVSFVTRLPDERLRTQPITLSLEKIPFTAALRYVGDLANVRFNFEKYAIVVLPKGDALSAPEEAKKGRETPPQ